MRDTVKPCVRLISFSHHNFTALLVLSHPIHPVQPTAALHTGARVPQIPRRDSASPARKRSRTGPEPCMVVTL